MKNIALAILAIGFLYLGGVAEKGMLGVYTIGYAASIAVFIL